MQKATHPDGIEHAEGSSSSSLSPDPTECSRLEWTMRRDRKRGGKRCVAVVVELDPISASTNEEEEEEEL